MSPNKEVVAKYLEGFRRGDHARILSCLTEDIEWIIPGAFNKKGKKEFDAEIENAAFKGHPVITTTRMTEADEVVVAEGTVRTQKKTGEFLDLAMCDVFELRDGKIHRLTSYLMPITR